MCTSKKVSYPWRCQRNSAIFLDNEQGLFSGPNCSRQKNQEYPVCFGTGDEAVVERLKTKASQPPDTSENPMHSVCYPFVKMSEETLAIVLYFFGIGNEQQT